MRRQFCLLIYDSFFKTNCTRGTDPLWDVSPLCNVYSSRIRGLEVSCGYSLFRQNIHKRKGSSISTDPITMVSTTGIQSTASTRHPTSLPSTTNIFSNETNKSNILPPTGPKGPKGPIGHRGEWIPVPPVPSNYFFIAINVIAKTVINTHEIDCAKRGGYFDPLELTCHIGPAGPSDGSIFLEPPNAPSSYPEVKQSKAPVRNTNKRQNFVSSKNNSKIVHKNLKENVTIIGTLPRNVTDIKETWKNTSKRLLILYESAKSSKSLVLLNIIGNSCSIVCLVALIGTYFIVKPEFSLMDKNVICLSIFLCLAHVLQLTTVFFSDTIVYCKISAVFLHWSLLMSFSWMSVISYDLFITFTKLKLVRQATKKKRFKRYVIGVCIPCTTIVLVCVFLGIPKSDYTGYGYQGKCFIVKFWANLITFTIPILLMLLINTLLMVVTICKLKAMEKASHRELAQNSNGESARKKVVITALTLKLSVLFGLGWLFGLIGPFVDNTAMQFIFNVIVSFQGSFIYVAFGCHKSLLKRCCKKRVNKHDRQLNPNNQNTKSTSV
eukprot:Seg3326.1 transcript_id=Seg3326.1/GoldUCD/mRNA.D3Y31 product="Adhesion G protein-coupled receptor L2" protein_id=Seg3326.1/GoldUCD/D3Y31